MPKFTWFLCLAYRNRIPFSVSDSPLLGFIVGLGSLGKVSDCSAHGAICFIREYMGRRRITVKGRKSPT